MKTLQRQRRAVASRTRRAAARAAAPDVVEHNRSAVAQALGAPVQAKLALGRADDVCERDADRVADAVMRGAEVTAPATAAESAQRACAECSAENEELQRKAEGAAGGTGAVAGATAGAINARRGSGSALPPAERSFFEPRLRADLSQVRIHADGESARLARGLSARAFTVGRDVFFGAEEYRPGTPGGRHLLAHELAHVRQQSSAAPAPVVRRQESSATTQPVPAFDRKAYAAVLDKAVAMFAGQLVEGQTLATEVAALMRALLAQAVWRNAKGKESGGRRIRHKVSGTAVDLRLVLDENPDAKVDGMFRQKGATEGEIFLFVARIADADRLALTMYHEAMHLVAWLSNRKDGTRFSGAGAEVARSLDRKRYSAPLRTFRRYLEVLSDYVNDRRGASNRIDAAAVDRAAEWLLDEVLVRAETSLFAEFQGIQGESSEPPGRMDRGGKAEVEGAGALLSVKTDTLDVYLFNHSGVFVEADRVGRTGAEKRLIEQLAAIASRLFDLVVRRRFSSVAFPVPSSRPAIDLQPTLPSKKPSFLPLPEID